MSWELTTQSNYTYFTNTVENNLSIRYPSKDIFYRESPNAIDIVFKFDRSTMAIMQKSDITSPVFANNDALILWLDENTGGDATIEITTEQVVDVSIVSPDPLNVNVATIKQDYYLEVSSGNIPGVSHINKFGVNTDITADAQEDVWEGGGTYPFPTTTDITHLHQVTDQAAMRGGEINIQGLDANWDLVVQNKNLDLTDTSTPVILDTPLIRVFRLKVQSNVVADSDIHLNDITGNIIYATMIAGNNQTLMSIFTVPARKKAYLTQYYATVIDATNKTPTSTTFKLWAADRHNGYEFQLKHAIGIPSGGGMAVHDFKLYGVAGQKTDIKITARPADEGANVASGFGLILVDD